MTDTVAERPSTTDSALAVVDAAKQLAAIARSRHRDDLANRCAGAAARVGRPLTVVCVVGEFKQGKSSLVNGLVGTAVCPVDDDLATAAITVIRHGDEPAARVHRNEAGKVVTTDVAVDAIHEWVSEAGNHGNAKGVTRIDVHVPATVLRHGLAFVDTPGVGGLGAGHAAATLAFLPFADGVILVSDASAELSRPELDLVREARELCATVLLVQTKTDLYPDWRRIVELNRGHLGHIGADLPIVAVSNTLRSGALATRDRDLNERSGFPVAVAELDSRIVRRARADASTRARGDLRSVSGLLRSELELERATLVEPATLRPLLLQIESANERLGHLRGPAARWSTIVSDRITDLSAETSHQLRTRLRTMTRQFDEVLEQIERGDQWDLVVRELQTAVASILADAFATVERARVELRDQVVAVIDDEGLELPALASHSAPAFDAAAWPDRPIGEAVTAGGLLRSGLAGVRGGYSGVAMFGMLGNLLPAAGVGLLASNPVTLGIGALFGGLQLFDDRKRKVTMMRQSARSQLRQLVDDVQLYALDELSRLTRAVQRELRDEVGDRLAELQRTCADALRHAQDAAQRTESQAKRRLRVLDGDLEELDRVDVALRGDA